MHKLRGGALSIVGQRHGLQQLRYGDIFIGRSELVLELCGRFISRHRWLIELRVVRDGHVLRRRIKWMHELLDGHLPNQHRVVELHRLRCWDVFG